MKGGKASHFHCLSYLGQKLPMIGKKGIAKDYKCILQSFTSVFLVQIFSMIFYALLNYRVTKHFLDFFNEENNREV